MSYELILFDADDTLFDFSQSELNALKLSFGEHEIELSDLYFESYKKINQQLWKEFEEGKLAQDQLRVERFQRFFIEQGLTMDAAHFSTRYLTHLSEGAFLVPGALELCDYLKSHGYRLAIITNGIKEVQLKRIGKSELSQAFEQIIVSEETGYQKPQSGIFDYAFHKLNVNDKERVLMVGDSLTTDIQGGNHYGIDTCWFNPADKLNSSGIQPTYEISSLKELVGILEKNA